MARRSFNNNGSHHTGNTDSDGLSPLFSYPPVVCFSHLRWDFVYQRPQHLMSRMAKSRRVYFIEEAICTQEIQGPQVSLLRSIREHHIHVITPRVNDPQKLQDYKALESSIAELLKEDGVSDFVAWYYTPMALDWTSGLRPLCSVYDCMDELSLFRGAPREMVERDRELLRKADLIFFGGTSLYEAKRSHRSDAHCFPSAIDTAHFRSARLKSRLPHDVVDVPRPCIGYSGVLDERLDIALLDELSQREPNWHFVLIGPVVKIDPLSLPQHANIHYLGPRSYSALPSYMAGWDVAIIPFSLNDATRFVSPTKTPEYLAAGRPVVSTPIRDVLRPYGMADIVDIAEDATGFRQAIKRWLDVTPLRRKQWLTRVDGFLSTISWDRTFNAMSALLDGAVGHVFRKKIQVVVPDLRRTAGVSDRV